jgi:hypothetical protein
MPDDPGDCHWIFDPAIIDAIDELGEPLLLGQTEVGSSQLIAGLAICTLQGPELVRIVSSNKRVGTEGHQILSYSQQGLLVLGWWYGLLIDSHTAQDSAASEHLNKNYRFRRSHCRADYCA